MKMIALIFSVAALLVSGCAMTTQRTDPFAGLEIGAQADEVQTPLYPSLSLALVMSENSRRTAGVAQRAQSGSMGQIKGQSVFDGTLDLLKRNFKTVARVESPAAISSDRYDAVAVMDTTVLFPPTIYGEYRNDTRLLFLDSKGELLAEAKGVGVATAAKDTPGSFMTQGRYQQAMDIAHRRLHKQLYAALREVKHLADMQAKHRTPSPAAPAAVAPVAPAAPATKSRRSDLETPPFSLPEDSSKFALVVGVENYQNAPAADHSARDARAVKAHLRGLGYPERNIVLLTDQQAGKSSLEKYLDAWLPKNTDEGSTVAFYFSGHGAPNPGDGQAYLMPWDGDPKFLENTGYPVKRLYERLNALKAKRILVAMDACFSGVGGRSVIAKGTRPLIGKADEGREAAGRVAALTASASDETTGAAEEAGHGLFTYHLLKALGARGGRATFKQLYDDLTPKVRDAARRDNRDQTPQLIGDGSRSL
jgi:hypothetical protein